MEEKQADGDKMEDSKAAQDPRKVAAYRKAIGVERLKEEAAKLEANLKHQQAGKDEGKARGQAGKEEEKSKQAKAAP